MLLVEDEPILLERIEKMLSRLAYTVLAAATPGDAMRIAAHAGEIRVLLSDVVMPEMDGREPTRGYGFEISRKTLDPSTSVTSASTPIRAQRARSPFGAILPERNPSAQTMNPSREAARSSGPTRPSAA